MPVARSGHRFAASLAAAGLLLLFVSAQALGADTIYWANYTGNAISFARLDGFGGGRLSITGATPDNPEGVAIDSATGRLYWANFTNSTISFAQLDGSGGGQLNITGAAPHSPVGVAIDPAGGKIYWANAANDTISFAKLDGSGGGVLDINGATPDNPRGVAIDAAGGKIYWANAGNDTISFARLDNSGGGGQLETTGAIPSFPDGLAIDAAAGRIYWANNTSNAHPISYARLDNSGGGQLTTTGATASSAIGVAIDSAAGRIYWANNGNETISYARLDNSGGGQLDIAGALPSFPDFPVLLEAPAGAAAPAISAAGAALSCSRGSWAEDVAGAFLYRAPQTFAYQWSRNGTDLPGAGASTLTATTAGDYRCQVTARNQAGSASQVSAAHSVSSAAVARHSGKPNTRITKARISSRKHRARFTFRSVGNATGLQCELKRKHKRAKFRRCRSPKTYKHLKAGKYTFEVRAVGPAGRDPTPAKKTFRIR